MPELPEVETTLRGINPHIAKQIVTDVVIRRPNLRWPIPANLKQILKDQSLINLNRRGKYLLFQFKTGTLIMHLGMSGRMAILSEPVGKAQKHDHVDIYFANKKCLRFTDPRRFGAILWTDSDPFLHPLLITIGPEPLSIDFDGDYLFQKSRHKKIPVKAFVMNSAIVAGVGNIYATEALFAAKINPLKPAGKINRDQYELLAHAIKKILQQAITKGGTTLKDFMKSDETPGYFSIELKVYGQEGKPCPLCHTKLKLTRIGQRSSVYCGSCQV